MKLPPTPHPFRLRGLLALLCLALLPVIGKAQESASVRLSFGAVGLLDNLATLHLAAGADADGQPTEWLQVRLNQHTISQPIDYSGPLQLRFFSTESTAEPPVAATTVDGTAESLLLVFVPDDNNRYRIVQVNDDRFAFGSYYFHNLSPHPVALEVGDHRSALRPGEQTIVRAAAAASQLVRIYSRIDDQQRLIRSSTWRLEPGQRELIFFHTPPGTNLVQARHLISARPDDPDD